ncbi:hypothetical protein RIF29_20676 [Crotalaria pallida]|uniref:Uncharacterized protein n=1 Tax=Crotalaria pallida TaxID=3830 RepID=A0AAN9F3F4_CROPI
MPQLDLEKLVSALTSGDSDRKITCETLANEEDQNQPEAHPDSPPESFWLSGDAEYDWWDRNAVVYERKESTKGSSIFITNNSNPNSATNSQRFSKNLKAKAAIIGLPKPQKTSFAGSSRRHHRAGTGRLFPNRNGSIGKSESSTVIEPLSPKVSCIGRVRSNRNRRLRARQRSISSSTVASATTVVRQKSSRSGRKKTGFFESVRAIFRSGRRGKAVQKTEESTTKKNKCKGKKARGSSSRNDASFEEPVQCEPVGLGGMNRFSSGRRSESWGVGEFEVHVLR